MYDVSWYGCSRDPGCDSRKGGVLMKHIHVNSLCRKLMTGVLTAALAAGGTGAAAMLSGCGNAETAETVRQDSQSVESESVTAASEDIRDFSFGWSGGSGRAVITCTKVTDRKGQLYATIHFARANGGESSYTEVKSLGETVSGSNTFTIPVNRDKNTEIQALTTAMSSDHWIDYTIYVGTEGQPVSGGSVDELGFDTEAPGFTGLVATGEVDCSGSDYVRIFTYEDDISLIEIRLNAEESGSHESSTGGENLQSSSDSENQQSSTGDGALQSSSDSENHQSSTGGENLQSSSDGEGQQSSSSGETVRYLAAPEDAEIPAGTDRLATVVRVPAEKAFVSSEEGLARIRDLGYEGSVFSTDADAGDGWDWTALVKDQADLAVISPDMLAENGGYAQMSSEASELNIPLFVDESSQETEKGQEAWNTVYKILFGSGRSGSNTSGSSESGSAETGSEKSGSGTSAATGDETDGDETLILSDGLEDAPEIPGHTCTGRLNVQYAKKFRVYYYDGGRDWKVLCVDDGRSYLLVPEGEKKPSGLSDDIIAVSQPVNHIYMAATGSMCFFPAIDSLDLVTLSSLDTDGWTIPEPVKAMKSGKMEFAGKYSEPDYEMLVNEGCGLAIESTMILHVPEVQEMLEDLGIPVMIDLCSYESDPFGRMEWVKFYGALTGKEEEAADYFSEELDSLGDKKYKDTGKTVAFFAVDSNGQVTVRKTDDFIPNLIRMAGGNYAFKDLKNPGSSSASVNLTMEQFYADAKDADYLIYNATIESPVRSIKDLEKKNKLFKDFRAVKEGNVWQVDRSWYQSTDHVGKLLTDFHLMLTGGAAEDMTFLTRVK